MQRLIPNKTKVNVELFRGVTIGDIIVGAVALVLIVLILISNLPFKLGFCLIVAGLAALLVIRLDEQPNYIYFLHILTFLGYKRHFGRTRTDEILLDGAEERSPSPEKTKEEERADEIVAKETRKERAERIREEDRLIKAGAYSDEEKAAIMERRRQESREEARKAAAAKNASVKRRPVNEIVPFTGIRDGFIEYLNGAYYGAVLEIDPVDFRFFSEMRRTNSIENCFGRVLRAIRPEFCANIVKLEQPVMYDGYLRKEYDKLNNLSDSYENAVLTEDELKARVEIEYDRINELRSYCEDNKIVTPFYYLVLFDSDRRQLELQIREAASQLGVGELTCRRLNDEGLAIFLKYSNQLDFDEREVRNIKPEDLAVWAQPESVDIRVRNVEVNRIMTHNFRVVNYPTIVGDAWLAGVMSIPGTKVVVKCRPMDRAKAIRNIDHSLTELRGQWSSTGVDSRRMEIETHISTLQELLSTLQSDVEALLECNVYVTAYDIVSTRNNLRLPQHEDSVLPVMTDMKKNIRRHWQESGFRLNNMEFDQVQAFIGSQISAWDPLSKEGRGISSNTVAACYPWIFARISDEGGIKMGTSDGIPVFIDFFRRDSERVNSNMVIVGKSGSGKSYATKSLLANMAAEDAKIFILDPENEYTDLARNLHGQVINVGNAQYGRLNPFHIITALDDDEAGETGPSGSYATHLQFLEEFFRQIMPECENDAMEYLNTLVDHMYLMRDITGETDLSKLSPDDYPIFDDLYDEILQEFQSTDNPFTRDLLRTLMNYVAKFSSGGRNANIWNGPSTVTTDENFTVFNFQSMLANRNQTIANAQMLLVLKYIDNEIIKNRDYNLRYHADRKIVVVIDEAHVFIDTKFPVALDFMFQLAKRIRKYNGMQIVITQNIKDFVGSEDLARKSAAIINACQYSFIFSLAPNDMQDLVALYENAGGINESEQEQIVQAPRGQAFTIMSPSSRSTFRVETAQGITEMFGHQEYVSRYFSGEQGAEYWEEFVGGSRDAHEKAAAAIGRTKTSLALREPEVDTGSVALTVYEEDEYEELMRSQEAPVLLTETEEEPADPVKTVRLEQDTVRPQNLNTDQDNVFSMIATALGRMADAAERGGEQENTSTVLEQKMQERIRLLEEENERLRTSTSGRTETDDESVRVLPSDEEEDFPYLADEEVDDDVDDESVYGTSDEDDEDSYIDDDDGVFSVLFGDDEDLSFDESDADDEDRDEDDDEEDDDDDDDFGDPDEEDWTVTDESDAFDDGEDEDDNFMESFCSFAESLMSLSPFEKIRASGNLVSEISMDDLEREIASQQEKQRRMRAGMSM